jgi:mannosyl-3-phosphoglycerate phosphatase
MMTDPARPTLVVFTDLDGTLLDATTYRFEAARPALDRLRERDIPLVICTSKTRAEVEPLRKDLDNRHPFIVENGGALYVPEGYFQNPPLGSTQRNGYQVVEFGVPYSRLREALRKIEGQVGASLVGFGDRTIEEIMQLTGLAQAEAERARQREYDEPFLSADPSVSLETIREAAAQLGLSVVSGGRFYHLVGGTDKGRACRVLIDLYRRQRRDLVTVGLGDSLNDLPMLEVVDRAFLVERPGGGYAEGIGIESLTRLRGIGPVGWADGVRRLLAEPA